MPATCTLSYSFTVSPELVAPDNTAIQFNSDTRTFTILTDNIDIAGTYTITVSAVGPDGNVTPFSFDWELEIIDPCVSARIEFDLN